MNLSRRWDKHADTQANQTKGQATDLFRQHHIIPISILFDGANLNENGYAKSVGPWLIMEINGDPCVPSRWYIFRSEL